MRVWPISQVIQPNFSPPPPMYAWPTPIKRIILAAATAICVATYLLLIASLLGVSLLWLT
jgi:hypothetical protein